MLIFYNCSSKSYFKADMNPFSINPTLIPLLHHYPCIISIPLFLPIITMFLHQRRRVIRCHSILHQWAWISALASRCSTLFAFKFWSLTEISKLWVWFFTLDGALLITEVWFAFKIWSLSENSELWVWFCTLDGGLLTVEVWFACKIADLPALWVWFFVLGGSEKMFGILLVGNKFLLL